MFNILQVLLNSDVDFIFKTRNLLTQASQHISYMQFKNVYNQLIFVLIDIYHRHYFVLFFGNYFTENCLTPIDYFYGIDTKKIPRPEMHRKFQIPH